MSKKVLFLFFVLVFWVGGRLVVLLRPNSEKTTWISPSLVTDSFCAMNSQGIFVMEFWAPVWVLGWPYGFGHCSSGSCLLVSWGTLTKVPLFSSVLVLSIFSYLFFFLFPYFPLFYLLFTLLLCFSFFYFFLNFKQTLGPFVWRVQECKLPRYSLNKAPIKRIANTSTAFKNFVSQITAELKF